MAELATVIKHTKTIAEYKKVRTDMQNRADKYFHEHLQAYHDEWTNGEPVKAWYDIDGNLCVEYESGQWWHYRETAEGLQWW